MGLSLTNISHKYDDNNVLNDVGVNVPAGQILCLLGPSGCGKTTLLRIAAGLEKLQAGEVRIDDRIVADISGQVPAESRGVGLMFQDFALFPHLSVRDNIAFGLSTMGADEKTARISEVLRQVNMQMHADDFPHILSGGQQQRVALARALAPKPAVMLLDEPFSGLDQNMRIQIREETLSVLKSSGVATLMVTHNPEEALFMADRMIVMGPNGRIHQEGPPNEIYAQPKTAYVAKFFGQANTVTGVVKDEKVETPLGSIDVPGYADHSNLEIVIRPGAIRLKSAEKIDKNEGVAVEILTARSLGRNSFIRFKVKGSNLTNVDFHCRYRGAFLENTTSEFWAVVRQDRIFIFDHVE